MLGGFRWIWIDIDAQDVILALRKLSVAHKTRHLGFKPFKPLLLLLVYSQSCRLIPIYPSKPGTEKPNSRSFQYNNSLRGAESMLITHSSNCEMTKKNCDFQPPKMTKHVLLPSKIFSKENQKLAAEETQSTYIKKTYSHITN